MNNLVRIYTYNDEQLVKLFIESHPESIFFQSWTYTKLLTQLLQCEFEHLLCFDNETLAGVLPLLSKTGKYGKVYNSLPFYGSNGGVLATHEEAANELVKAYNLLIAEAGVAASTIIENPFSLKSYKHILKFNQTDYRIGQFTNIAYSDLHESRLLESFHYKTRNIVRKAMKNNLEIKVSNDSFDFLVNTHVKNMEAIGGKSKSELFFKLVETLFEREKDYKIWTAYYHGEQVAALLLFYYRDTVEYYTPVILEEHRDKQPLSLLIFESMTEASKRGYRIWNWGGTWATQGGVHTFKKRWGTYEKNYEYFIQINEEKLYSTSKDDLITNYPDFFVLPFNLLK